MPVGAIIGAFVGGIMATKLGRRKTFILADIIGIIGCVIWVFQGNGPLFVGRLVGGVAVGINSAIVPLYINEISPTKISGSMGSMTQLMINVGILSSFLLGLNISKSATIRAAPEDEWWWRFCFAFPIVTAVLRIICLMTCFKFETIPYLLQKGRDKEAKEFVKELYLEEYNEEILEEYKQKINNCNNVSFSELFGKRYRKRMIMGILLCFIQQFAGCNAVLFYSDKIFKGDGDPDNIDPFDDKMAKVFTILIGCILIFASWLAGKIIDKFGRKSMLLLGEILCITTLILLTIFGFLKLTEPSKYIILIYIFSYGASLGPIVWLYLPEILPEKGVSVAAIANWVGCGILGFIFPILRKAIEIQGTFLIFLGCCVLAMIYMSIFVKETKGKTTEEIEELFRNDANKLENEKNLIVVNTSVPPD